jgi:ABC-2 type transport system ATP-binding protein
VLKGVDAVSSEAGRIVVSTSDGPAQLSRVAIALGATSLRVKTLTLRTPTLDDVFMELTGSHIREPVPA